jgi:hypothetical protein
MVYTQVLNRRLDPFCSNGAGRRCDLTRWCKKTFRFPKFRRNEKYINVPSLRLSKTLFAFFGGNKFHRYKMNRAYGSKRKITRS